MASVALIVAGWSMGIWTANIVRQLTFWWLDRRDN